MNTISEKTIDIDKVLAEKAGKKARYVPRFVRNWLKRLVHQDEINGFLWNNRDKEGVDWLEAVLRFLDVRVEVHGANNLPPAIEGRHYTFVSNHPLSSDRQTLRRKGEVSGQRPADEPAQSGTALHTHQQDRRAGKTVSGHG